MWENYSVIALTAALNKMPYVPGQLGALGIFQSEGVTTTSVRVEEQNGTLAIIEPTPRGGPGQTVADGDRKLVTFEVDHFEINDSVMADEVQGVRAFGTDNELQPLDAQIDNKLAKHARSFDTTLEHQRVGAIKGVVLSGQGKVLHNLYNRFEIAIPAPVTFSKSGQIQGIASKIQNDILYTIEDEIDGSYDHIHAMTGRDFHEWLWQQDEVRETYLADRQGHVLRDGAPDIINVGKVTFERYRTGKAAAKANKDGAQFIAADEARVFPVGVPDLFLTRFAPADLEETVNTMGLPRYSHQYPMSNGKGRHLDSQMNAINICTQPAALRTIKLTT